MSSRVSIARVACQIEREIAAVEGGGIGDVDAGRAVLKLVGMAACAGEERIEVDVVEEHGVEVVGLSAVNGHAGLPILDVRVGDHGLRVVAQIDLGPLSRLPPLFQKMLL